MSLARDKIWLNININIKIINYEKSVNKKILTFVHRFFAFR
jgi:hypothetical protein